MNEVFLLDARRTPRGRGKPGKGGLSGVHPQDLVAQCLNAATERAGVSPADVGNVIIGSCCQVAEQAADLGRASVLAAGWDFSVPGISINAFCGSGLQGVALAAQSVAAGVMDCAVGGGVESMSRVPMNSEVNAIAKYPGADIAGLDGGNMAVRERVPMVMQGIAADAIATLERFSRAELDEVALRSHQLAAQAAEAGRFSSLVPVVDRQQNLVLDRDECIRPTTSLESLAELQPAFVKLAETEQGVRGETLREHIAARLGGAELRFLHTPGNSSALADGAAVALTASRRFVEKHGLKPRAKIRAMAFCGSDPILMLTGPAAAANQALEQAGMTKADIDLWEINEAFASVLLQTVRALELDLDKVNVNGGAIALGHPLGATGAILLSTVMDELEAADLQTGLVTMCIATGMAVSMIVERVS